MIAGEDEPAGARASGVGLLVAVAVNAQGIQNGLDIAREIEDLGNVRDRGDGARRSSDGDRGA
jgi:hypothetical protein